MTAVVAAGDATDFWQALRTSAWGGVEYSYDGDAHRHSVTVGGGLEMMGGVAGFCSGRQWSAALPRAAQRFAEQVRPDALLFRVDWTRGAPDAVSLYMRYPRAPDDAMFARSMDLARPWVWTGPSVAAVAAALHVPGPRGAGLRVDAAGRMHVAVYYTVDTFVGEFGKTGADRLVSACGLAADVSAAIRADSAELYGSGPVGVVGLDGDGAGGTGAIKLNPANVPVRTTLTFLEAKGGSAERVGFIQATARDLHAASVSYVGLRYGGAGLSGWRVYFSVAPQSLAPPLLPGIRTHRTVQPTIRLPHR